ncbi:MAG: S46 family peptidase, partial [Lentimicrobiaceae bacterium]|nr:S46 family peptidase [Lentimicrobiaceae bacterium]
CDFAMFRIYTAPDGSPAPFSKDNIPLIPKHFLPVSTKGVEEGDFAMILGFPGTTDRFLTSYGLEETMNITNKLRYEIRDVKINILREEMAASQKVRIQYASKYASCSNYWKYSLTQNKALKNLNTMEIKQQIEADFTKWANANKDPKYKDALPLIEKGYNNRKEYMEARMYLIEALWGGTELPSFAYQMDNLLYPKEYTLEKGETYTPPMEKIKELAAKFYKDYNPETEKKLIIALFEHAYKNMDRKYYPNFFFSIEKNKKCKGDISKCVEQLFATSVFATEEKFNEFIEKFKWSDKDPYALAHVDVWVSAGANVRATIRDLDDIIQQNAEDFEKGKRLFVDGILQINAEKSMAPDANSTIRLTYGTINPYEPRDGVTYHHYTTLKGVMEKEDPTSSEFIVPEKLKDLYNKKEFGAYTNDKNEVVACFISNNDITGGNSGSPVINAEGHLIGLAFDGNSEAMSGDIDFEENLQRCINLDVRYMLFVIDKFAGARHLIEEMEIVGN